MTDPHPQRCPYLLIGGMSAICKDSFSPSRCICDHNIRPECWATSHSSATEPMPPRSCFGNFIDCPYDDECVVSLYCADYQKRRLNDSYHLLDDILTDLSGRSCIGAALEKIEEEHGKGWLRNDIMKAVLGDRT